MSIDASSLLLWADEGDSIFLASGGFMTWKATGETTAGKYDQGELVTLPHAGPPEHTHTQDELFYFLKGTYRMKLSNQVFTLSAGDFVFPQLLGWCHFKSFSQLAATLTIAKINKKVVYGAFFDWLKRK